MLYLFFLSFINVVSVFYFCSFYFYLYTFFLSSSLSSIECVFLGQNRGKLLLYYFFLLVPFFFRYFVVVASPKFYTQKKKTEKYKDQKKHFFFAWNEARHNTSWMSFFKWKHSYKCSYRTEYFIYSMKWSSSNNNNNNNANFDSLIESNEILCGVYTFVIFISYIVYTHTRILIKMPTKNHDATCDLMRSNEMKCKAIPKK